MGDHVYLWLKNMATDRPSKKLDWIAAPYRVVKECGSHTYKLNTPHGIYPVFYACLLRCASEDLLPLQQTTYDEPGPTLIGTE